MQTIRTAEKEVDRVKMIPDRWKIVPLEEVAQVQTGLAKGKKNIRTPVTVPYLRVANVQDGYLDLSIVKSIQVEESCISRYLLRPGDVLLTEGGDFDKLGRGTVWQGAIEPCLHQNHIFVVRPKKNSLHPQFLSLLTGSSYGKAYFLKCSKQSTNLASINSTQLKYFPVLLPHLDEQKKIVGIIKPWDQAIEKTEKLISSKERYFAYFQQNLLTGKKRLKGFKQCWHRCQLSEVLVEHGKLSTGNEVVYSVSVHKGLIDQIEHLGRSFAAKDVSNYNLVKPGDVVYTKSPTGDFPYGIIKQSQLDYPVIVSPLYGVFSPETKQLGSFLHFYFESPVNTGNYLRPIIQKGAKNTIGITNSTFLQNSLYLPTCDKEMLAIVTTFSEARSEIDLLKKQLEAYKKQKRGLMQKLLTGQWRVNGNGDLRSDN